ncbi:MAG TPA: hypothetical protein VIM71_07545 [Lacunisphaera sp.]
MKRTLDALLICSIGLFVIAGCATSRPVAHADLPGVYEITMSFDTHERITLKTDGVAIYESIPLLSDVGDLWRGRWEAHGESVVLRMPMDRGTTAEIPLKINRRNRHVELLYSPKSWSEVVMVLPGVYAK